MKPNTTENRYVVYRQFADSFYPEPPLSASVEIAERDIARSLETFELRFPSVNDQIMAIRAVQSRATDFEDFERWLEKSPYSVNLLLSSDFSDDSLPWTNKYPR